MLSTRHALSIALAYKPGCPTAAFLQGLLQELRLHFHSRMYLLYALPILSDLISGTICAVGLRHEVFAARSFGCTLRRTLY
jgi:hypothetical protein